MILYIITGLVALISYFLGSVSGAILVSKKVDGEDIRTKGSKNAGTTNMLRVYGKKAAVITFLIDILKGVAAVLIAMLIEYLLGTFSDEYDNVLLAKSLRYIACVFAVLGHDFPIYFKFKGGKGVATSIAAVLLLDWEIGLILIATAIIIILISKYVSLGSVIVAVLYPFMALAFMLGGNNFNIYNLASSIILSLLIIVKHRANIKRLKAGTENKMFTKKKKTSNE